MRVSVSELDFELKIVPLVEIRPHEAVIAWALDSMVADLNRTGMQRDPILIDARTHTVLDGMHRREALERAKAKFAVCSEYNYENDSIKLERWLRYVIAPSEEFLSDVSKLLDLEECDDYRDAVRAVDEGKSRISILSAGLSYVSKKDWKVLEVYNAISEVDDLCHKYRMEINFTPESSKFELFTSESVYLIYPEKLSKNDVLEIASLGRVLPCKTTRHVVPIRPMGVYFPLDKLRHSSETECTRELERLVKLSTIKMEEREVWYEGRRYSEPLAIFRREK